MRGIHGPQSPQSRSFVSSFGVQSLGMFGVLGTSWALKAQQLTGLTCLANCPNEVRNPSITSAIPQRKTAVRKPDNPESQGGLSAD